MRKILMISLTVLIMVGLSVGSLAAEKELTLWTWKVAYAPGFRAVADAFEEETGVKVNIETFTPDNTYKQKVKAAANTKMLPDIVHWWGAKGEGIENSLLQLSSHFDQSFKDRIYDSSWNRVTVKEQDVKRWEEDEDASEVLKSLKAGEFYGVPLDVGSFFTFYGNKKVIKEAGLEAKAPETWEEFLDMMKTIKEKTGTPGLVFGGKLPDLWQNWCGNALMAMNYGPDGFSDLLAREARLSDPDKIVAIEAAEKLVENDLLLPGILSMAIDTADQAFAAHRAAFDLGGSFTMATLLTMGMDQENIMAFPVPPIEGSEVMQWKTSPFLLTMLSVSKYSENSELALQFIDYISSQKGAVLFANDGYTIPAVKFDEEKKDELKPGILAMLNSFSYEEDILAEIPEYPTNFWNNAEWDALFTMYQKIFSGAATAEEAAAKFDEVMEKEMK